MSYKLDRGYGTFEHIASAAYQEGLEEAYKMLNSNSSDDDVSELVDDYNQLQDNFDRLKNSYKVLQEKLKLGVEDYNELVTEFNRLLGDRNERISENENLNDKINSLNEELVEKDKQYNILKNKWVDLNTKLNSEINDLNSKEEEHYVRMNNMETEKKQTENVFAILYKNKSENENKLLFGLKNVKFQNKFLSDLVFIGINKGLFSLEQIAKDYNLRVEKQDSVDEERNSVTLSEAIAWLNLNHPEFTTDILKRKEA